jgi:hypothetical protein
MSIFFSAFKTLPLYQKILGFVPRFMHFCFDYYPIPLWDRVILHFMWNSLVFTHAMPASRYSLSSGLWFFLMLLIFDIETNPGEFDEITEVDENTDNHTEKCDCWECRYDFNFEKSPPGVISPPPIPVDTSICSCQVCRDAAPQDVRLLTMVISTKNPLKYKEDVNIHFFSAHGHRLLFKEQLLSIFDKKGQGWGDFDPLGTKSLATSVNHSVEILDNLARTCVVPNFVNTVNSVNGTFTENVDKVIKNMQDVSKDGVRLNLATDDFFTMLKNPVIAPTLLAFSYIVLEMLGRHSFYGPYIRPIKYIVAMAGIATVGIGPLGSYIYKWISGAQADDIEDGVSAWMGLITEGIGIAIFGTNLSFGSASDFVKSLINIEAKMTSIEKLVERVRDWFTKLVIALSESFNLSIGNWFNSRDNQLKDLQRECATLMDSYLENPMKVTVAMSERVTRLSMKILDFTCKVPTTQANQPVISALGKLSDKIYILQRNLADSGIALGERDEPGLVVISGGPGCGKTYFSDFIAQDVAIAIADPEEHIDICRSWKSHVYIWPVDGKHHDQYRGQYVIIFPDLFCQTDAEGMPGEAAYLVYLIGGQPLNLLAAEVTKKQRLYVVSGAIIACTNVIYIHNSLFKSIRNPDAVRRRVNEFGWYMYCNPKYIQRDMAGNPITDPTTHRVQGYEGCIEMYGMLDKDKIPVMPDGLLCPDIWFFRRHNFTTGTFSDNQIISQKSFFNLLHSYLKSKKENSEKKRDLMDRQALYLLAQKHTKQTSQEAELEITIDTTYETRIESISKEKKIREDEAFVEKLMATTRHQKNLVRQQKKLPASAFRIKPPRVKKKHCQMDNAEADEFLEVTEMAEIQNTIADPMSTIDFLKDSYNFLVFGKDALDRTVFEELQNLYTSYVLERSGRGDMSLPAVRLAANSVVSPHAQQIISTFLANADFVTYSNIFTREREFWAIVLEREAFKMFHRLEFKFVRRLLRMNYEEAAKNVVWFYYTSSIKNPLYCRIVYLKDMMSRAVLELSNVAGQGYRYVTRMWNLAMTNHRFALFMDGFAMSCGMYAGMAVGMIVFMKVLQWMLPPLPDPLKGEDVPVVHTADVPMEVSINQAGWVTDTSNDSFISAHMENFFMLYVERVTPDDKFLRHPCNLVFLGERLAVLVNHTLDGIYRMKEERPTEQINLILVNFSLGTPANSTLRYRFEDIEICGTPELKAIDLNLIRFKTGRKYPILDKMIPPKACLQYMLEKKDIMATFVQKPLHGILPSSPAVQQHVRLNYTQDPSCGYMCSVAVGNDNYNLGYVSYHMFAMQGINPGFYTICGDCSTPGFITDTRKNFCVNMDWKQAQQPWFAYLHTSMQHLIPHGVPIHRELFQSFFDEMRMKDIPTTQHLAETVQEYIAAFKEMGLPQIDQGCSVEISPSYQPLDKFHESFASLSVPFTTFTSSSIVRSPCYGLDTPTRVPARLRDYVDKRTGTLVKVMEKAREPYGSNQVIYNETLFSCIVDDVVARIMTESELPTLTEVLSIDQVLYGDVAYNLAPVDWGTSAGVMLRTMCKLFGIKTKGKRFMAENGKIRPEYYRLVSRLIEFSINKMKKGQRVGNVFNDNLKDELLKFEKVLDGKTRLFCSGDFIFFLLCKMYFGAFVGWIYRNRVRNGIVIGVNPYGREWDAIWTKLIMLSVYMIFGDYGKFDKKQRDLLMMAALRLSHKFYNDYGSEAYYIRELLFEDIIHSIHMCVHNLETLFYMWEHGNTSGNFLTAVINSIVNICIVHIAFCLAEMLFRGVDINKSLDYNFELVSSTFTCVVLGDDIVISVKPRPWNTFSVLKKIIETQLGLEFTDELKTGGDIPDYRSITEGSFLGRKFVQGYFKGVPKIWSPLRLYSVIECVLWIKGVFDPEIEVLKFEALNLELSLHEKDVFMQYVPRYAAECNKKYGRYPRYTDYDSARERVVSLASYIYAFDQLLIMDNTVNDDSGKFDRFLSLMNLITKEHESDHSLVWSGVELYTKPTPPSRELLDLSAVSNEEIAIRSILDYGQSDSAEGAAGGGTDFDSGTTVNVNATTQFIEAAPIVMGATSQPTTKVSTYTTDLTSIQDFLTKPQLIGNGQWTTSNTQNQNLFSQSVAALLSSVTVWANKIQGFNLIRGDLIVTIEMNASPFQQGKLLLHYLPCVVNFTNVNPLYLSLHNTVLMQKVQHPHIEIECRKTSSKFRIPYVAPTHFYDIKQGMYDWGTFYLDVFSVLQTGAAAPSGQNYVDYLVYANWENIELCAPMIAQSSSRETKSKKRAGAVEETAENAGPISSGLRKVGTVANSIATVFTEVPVIGNFVGALGWAANIAAGVASIFGWSKPRELTGVNVVTNQPQRYAGTCDGPDLALPGGISCLTRIETIDYGSYTDEDEMTLAYLYKIPNYMETVSWAAGAGQGASLYSFEVSPATLYQSATSATIGGHASTYNYTAPIGYLAQFHAVWRGSLILTLKFVKTQMHSGRLQLTWTPSSTVDETPTVSTSTLSLRAIIDVRVEDEVSFELPYLIWSDFLSLESGYPTTSGQVDILVLNDLRAPESCAQQIDMQIFYRAGDDFEMGVPKSYTTGCVPCFAQSGSVEMSLHGEGTGVSMGQYTIGDLGSKRDPLMHVSRCLGEKIFSIKSYLLRNMFIPNLINWLSTHTNIIVAPWFTSVCGLNPETGVIYKTAAGGDLLSWLANMYAFQRGSIKLCFNDPAGTTPIKGGVWPGHFMGAYTQPVGTNDTSVTNLDLNSVATLVYSGSKIWPTEPVNYYNDSSNSRVFQHYPYYARFPFSLVTYFDDIDQPMVEASTPLSLASFTGVSNFSTSATLQRAVGEDYQLMFFIGCPPFMTGYT